MTTVVQNQGISSSVQIVLIKMMMELIQTQMMMAGTNLFGIREYWVKDYYSRFTTTLTTITTEYQTVKIPMMITMAYLTKIKRFYVLPVKNRASGTMITMES